MSDLASGNNGPGICMYVCVWRLGGWVRGRKVKVSVSLSLFGSISKAAPTHGRGRTEKGEGATDGGGGPGGREVGRPFAYDVRTEGGEGVGTKSEDSTDRLFEWDTDKG